MFTPLFTPSTKYAVQQKEKQPCKYLQSHYPIPQKIIHQSLHHSPIYMYIAQNYTRKKDTTYHLGQRGSLHSQINEINKDDTTIEQTSCDLSSLEGEGELEGAFT